VNFRKLEALNKFFSYLLLQVRHHTRIYTQESGVLQRVEGWVVLIGWLRSEIVCFYFLADSHSTNINLAWHIVILHVIGHSAVTENCTPWIKFCLCRYDHIRDNKPKTSSSSSSVENGHRSQTSNCSVVSTRQLTGNLDNVTTCNVTSHMTSLQNQQSNHVKGAVSVLEGFRLC